MSEFDLENKIKISIIEDSEIHLEWLKAELQTDKQFSIVSADQSARQGIISIKTHDAD